MAMQAQLSENGYMASKKRTTRSNRIAEARKRAGLSQQALADAVGAHWITISKLERGQMQLTSSWLDRIGDALQINPAELLSRSVSPRRIEVEGVIKTGGIAEMWDETSDANMAPGDFLDADTSWMLVEGDALWPLFQAGDLARFVHRDLSDAPSYLGRLVIAVPVGEAESAVGIVGFLERGSEDGLFDIRPLNQPPRKDVSVDALWVLFEAHFGWQAHIANKA